MSSLAGPITAGNRSPEGGDDLERLVDRERRLGDVGDPLGIRDVEPVDLLDGSDELDRVGRLAHRADDLLVALVADQHDRVAPGRVSAGLGMHLADERAGCVEHPQAACLRVAVDLRRDPVGGENHRAALGHVELGVDEDRAPVGKLGDDVAVVHDLLAHVDRRAEMVERPLDRVHGPVDAGAVAARRCQHELSGNHGVIVSEPRSPPTPAIHQRQTAQGLTTRARRSWLPRRPRSSRERGRQVPALKEGARGGTLGSPAAPSGVPSPRSTPMHRGSRGTCRRPGRCRPGGSATRG